MFWNVYRNGKLIDTIWYTKDCDQEYVRSNLVNHDSYPHDIVVRRVK